MGRIAVLTISIIVLLSTATPSALEGAQGPPEDVDLDFTASEIGVFLCEFDIRFQVSGKQGMIELPGGGLIVTSPALRATLTNLTSGESVTLSITGAFHITTLENGNVQTVYTGRNILGDPLEASSCSSGRLRAWPIRKQTGSCSLWRDMDKRSISAPC